jgi:hypothetical protein
VRQHGLETNIDTLNTTATTLLLPFEMTQSSFEQNTSCVALLANPPAERTPTSAEFPSLARMTLSMREKYIKGSHREIWFVKKKRTERSIVGRIQSTDSTVRRNARISRFVQDITRAFSTSDSQYYYKEWIIQYSTTELSLPGCSKESNELHDVSILFWCGSPTLLE